jgi:predicted N-formylglutamate amidohydrolase
VLGLPSQSAVNEQSSANDVGGAIVVSEAFELVRGAPDAPVFFTCEHASQRLPPGWAWPEPDLRLVDTHWAYDLGAREITLALARELGATAVLARFTRLLADPNRDAAHDDMFRALADGQPVLLNTGLDEADKQRRIEQYHRPYHEALDAALAAHCSRADEAHAAPRHGHKPLLFSVHSFTPLYQGVPRDVELGVLFNQDEDDALKLGATLMRHFQRVAYNEPWSGRSGLIYSAERHATKYGLRALELEVRQDLAVDPAYQARLVPVLVAFFRSLRAAG